MLFHIFGQWIHWRYQDFHTLTSYGGSPTPLALKLRNFKKYGTKKRWTHKTYRYSAWMMNSLVVSELERALHAWLWKPLSHPTLMVNPLDVQSNLYKSITLGTTQKWSSYRRSLQNIKWPLIFFSLVILVGIKICNCTFWCNSWR